MAAWNTLLMFFTWSTSQTETDIFKYSISLEMCELPHFAPVILGKIELINENVKDLLNLSAS